MPALTAAVYMHRYHKRGCVHDICIRRNRHGGRMNLGTILLIVLVLALIGAIPAWPYSTGWGYYPSGLGLVVLIVLLIILFR